MLDVLRKWFSNPPTRLSQQQLLVKVESSLEDYKKHHLAADFTSHKDKIEQIVSSVRKAIDTLHNATVSNPSLPMREIQIMQGNRSSYGKYALQLVNQLPDVKNIDQISKAFDASIFEEFGKQTKRSRAVLDHFFANTVSEIHLGIGKLYKEYEYLATILTQDRHKYYRSLHLAYEHYKEQVEQKQHAGLVIEQKESEREGLDRLIRKQRKELTQLQSSQQADEYRVMHAELEHNQQEIQKIETELRQFFTLIERPLRKFSRLSLEHDEWIKKYLDAPLDGLMSDSTGFIVSILTQLKRAIDKGSVDIKNADRVTDTILTYDIMSIRQQLINARGVVEHKQQVLHNNSYMQRCDSLQVSLDRNIDRREQLVQSLVRYKKQAKQQPEIQKLALALGLLDSKTYEVVS